MSSFIDKRLKLLIIVIVGITSFTLLIILNFNLYTNPSTPPKESVSNINLFVDYKNGTIKTRLNFTLDNRKTTAFDALDKWCDIKYVDFGWGIFVDEIDGVNGNWIFMVNNNTPFVSAPNYQLDDGDEVKWLIGELI